MRYAPALMQSRLRLFVALLLLAAAGIHPLVHVAAQECPCLHGVTVTLAAPDFTREAPMAAMHDSYVPTFGAATFAGDLPARAPPAA